MENKYPQKCVEMQKSSCDGWFHGHNQMEIAFISISVLFKPTEYRNDIQLKRFRWRFIRAHRVPLIVRYRTGLIEWTQSFWVNSCFLNRFVLNFLHGKSYFFLSTKPKMNGDKYTILGGCTRLYLEKVH